MITWAITRLPAENLGLGLTTANLGSPDYAVALRQHAAYVAALKVIGLEVTVLEPLPDFPDAHFVEDTAVVFPELAVITRPGATARRGEIESMEPVLARHRPTVRITAPGTLDGGDVLTIGDRVYVGLTDRTNQAGFEQLRDLLKPYGYNCHAIPVAAGLHLKSSVNYAGKNTLLVTAALADCPEWSGYQLIVTAAGEEYACNTLLVNDHLLTPGGFPNTNRQLAVLELPLIKLDMSEMRKMDGGLTCLSLRF
ncbi:MAG: amidinotransferase [Candidatus Neomarinimicrobiota bacterium]